ncbi:MAG TPA: hypothetical protein VMV10_00960 [Pirellulales bacterium]|nr:hypothetical protein [Pirellulales bacterium]
MKLSRFLTAAVLLACLSLGPHRAEAGDGVAAPAATPTPAPDVAAWQTEFRERRYRVARPVWETTEQETRTKVLRPVWETQWREETYTVRKPLVETALREERYTLFEPVTVHQPQTIDQGQFVEEQVVSPRKPATRLKWIPGGWTADAQTGHNYWKPPMLRPVQVARPPRVETRRVWRPKLVETQVPTTTYAPRVHVRKVPLEQVRFVEERRTRKVPQRVCRMVEQEIVQRVPVTVCRTVYEEKVERIPVRVPRRAAGVVVPAPYDEGEPALVPVPPRSTPVSPPQLDPRLPVPAPAFPAEAPEAAPQSSHEDSRVESLDPASVALHPLPELLSNENR